MPSRIMVYIALLALSCGLIVGLGAPPAAVASEQGCRRSVVIYLDVSGSMYELRTAKESPWSEGKRLLLMENTVRFLQKCLLAPNSRAVRPGDRVVVRGFYSQVGTLVSAIDHYDPQRDLAVFAKLDQSLDVNHNRRYDICDAAPKNCGNKHYNPFLADQASQYTDFAPVARDMLTQYRITSLNGSPHGFDEMYFIVLTDGGHDYEPTLDAFEDELRQVAQAMGPNLADGKVKVLIFGLSGIERVEERHDVRPAFRQWLKAASFPLDPSVVTVENLNAYFTKVANRIQIQEVKRLGYDRKTRRLSALLTLLNRSCDPLSLGAVGCLVHGEGGGRLLCKTQFAAGQTLAAQELASLDLGLELGPNQELSPGKYQVTLTPLSAQVGPGSAVQAELVVKPPPPPPPPPEGASPLLVLVLAFLLLAVLGVLIWRFFSR